MAKKKVFRTICGAVSKKEMLVDQNMETSSSSSTEIVDALLESMDEASRQTLDHMPHDHFVNSDELERSYHLSSLVSKAGASSLQLFYGKFVTDKDQDDEKIEGAKSS